MTKYYIEYYITPYKYILREFEDVEAFEQAKMAMQMMTGKSISCEENGFDIIIPIDKVILVRCYEQKGEE